MTTQNLPLFIGQVEFYLAVVRGYKRGTPDFPGFTNGRMEIRRKEDLMPVIDREIRGEFPLYLDWSTMIRGEDGKLYEQPILESHWIPGTRLYRGPRCQMILGTCPRYRWKAREFYPEELERLAHWFCSKCR